RNQQEQEKAMVALFSKATSVQDIVSVQNQLAGIREQIERLQGRINFLDHQVAFSTITIQVREAGVGVAPGGDEWGFRTALVQAAHYFVNTIDGVLVVLGATGPVLVLVLLGAFLFWRRRLLPARPAPVPPS